MTLLQKYEKALEVAQSNENLQCLIIQIHRTISKLKCEGYKPTSSEEVWVDYFLEMNAGKGKTNTVKECRCKGCGKTPEEIMEYKVLAEEEGYSSATEAVIKEEGTYNSATGMFWCTDCYIKAGQPLGKA